MVGTPTTITITGSSLYEKESHSGKVFLVRQRKVILNETMLIKKRIKSELIIQILSD